MFKTGVQVDNEGIQAIIMACPQLRMINFKVVTIENHLLLSESHKTQSGIQCACYLDASVIRSIPIHCPDVELLRLYGSTVDRELFLNISVHCKRLHTLDLRRLKVPFEDMKIIASNERYGMTSLPPLVRLSC